MRYNNLHKSSSVFLFFSIIFSFAIGHASPIQKTVEGNQVLISIQESNEDNLSDLTIKIDIVDPKLVKKCSIKALKFSKTKTNFNLKSNCGVDWAISLNAFENPNAQELKDEYSWNKFNPLAKYSISLRKQSLLIEKNTNVQSAARKLTEVVLFSDKVWLTKSELYQ